MIDAMKFGQVTGALGALAIAVGFATNGFAADGHAKAPYAGQQTRTIKSFSQDDIEALRAGSGWGFAKPAELNGYPGPAHVLELDKELGLDNKQRARIKAIFADMQAAAQRLGRDYLSAEQALDAAFANGDVDAEKLARLTQAAARVRADLRSTHLRAHLLVKPLLNKSQLHRYAVLRGYAGDSHATHGSGGHGQYKGSHSGH